MVAHWIECAILGDDGDLREIRLAAIYQFLARVAVIRVAGRDAAALRRSPSSGPSDALSERSVTQAR